MKTLYLCGAIMHNPNYKQEFAAAQKGLTEAGYNVILLLDICDDGWDWQRCIRRCIEVLAARCGGFHIVYPSEGTSICSVIELDGSYGGYNDLLEIQGLMTKREIEENDGTVLGYLTAENVFNRIKRQYRSSAKKK